MVWRHYFARSFTTAPPPSSFAPPFCSRKHHLPVGVHLPPDGVRAAHPSQHLGLHRHHRRDHRRRDHHRRSVQARRDRPRPLPGAHKLPSLPLRYCPWPKAYVRGARHRENRASRWWKFSLLLFICTTSDSSRRDCGEMAPLRTWIDRYGVWCRVIACRACPQQYPSSYPLPLSFPLFPKSCRGSAAVSWATESPASCRP